MIPAVIQIYDTAITKEFVIRGNDALVKCSIPSFVTDFVTVISWTVQSFENNVEVTQGATLTGKFSLGFRNLMTPPSPLGKLLKV